MNLRNDIVRYARQKLTVPAPPPSQFARAYFVSHSPRIWHPMNVGITDEADPEDGSRQKVAYVSGMLNSIHPAMRYQWDANSHGGHFQRSMHILAPGAERDDALFGNSPQADNETDLREDEAHRYVAGQRAVRQFIGLDPAKTSYLTPVMTSKALADEAARATGGLVHEVWLNPKKLQANNAPAPVTVKDGSAILFSSPHHALSPNSDNKTHLDFNMQIQLAHTYTGDRGRQAIHNLCRFNQRYWPLLTQHADALRARSLPGAHHPHARLLGDVLADHKNLLAPSHEALMNAGGQVSEIYQAALRHPEEPVHRMALADTLDEHGQQDAADFFRSTLPGSEAAAKPKKFAKRNDIVRYARERLRYSAEQQPPVPRPAPEPPPQPVKPAKLKPVAPSLSVANLPPVATNHDYPDPIAQRIGHAAKLDEHLSSSGVPSNMTRSLFRLWAGRDVPDKDILDMMSVPRPANKGDKNHPVYLAQHNLKINPGSASPQSPDEWTLFGTQSQAAPGSGYAFEHNNHFRKDPATGEPHLYFSLVEHDGDRVSGEKQLSIPHMLFNAAAAAHRNGIKKIKLHAALGGSWVGGLVWPKLGFDSTLTDAYGGDRRTLNGIIQKIQKNPAAFGVDNGRKALDYTLLDALSHPQVFKWYYKDNGSGIGDTMARYPNARNMRKMTFDTDPSSRSMRLLTAYLRKLEGRPQ